MGALKPVLKDFLVREQMHMKERKFLINILTKTANRPSIMLHPTLILMASRGKLAELSLEHSLLEKIRPDLKQLLPPAQVSKLDEITKFIYENNIPIIQETENPLKLMLEYQNFMMFDEEERHKADAFSMKFRDQSNEDFFRTILIDNFGDKEIFEIINVVESDKKAYVAEFKTTGTRLAQKHTFDLCILSNDPYTRLMTEIDTLTLSGADMVNIKEPVNTTVGRMIVNELMLVQPFSDTFPYVNKPVYIDKGDIFNDVNRALMDKKINVEQYKKFLDALYYLGHFSELCTPGMDERSITTDPNLAKRKAELYKKYEKQLTDPLIIAKIEDELIAMDKAWMKQDNAMRFYQPLGGKSFDLWRKKLYIAVGGIEAFDKDSSKYDFVRNSLEEGQNLEDLPKYGNESRKGSYQRGHETRNGGALTKYIIRAFHDSRVQEEDCGTNKGISIDFSIYDINKYKGRYIWLNGKWTEINNENINKIPHKTYTMRSPMYCQCNKNGYCFKCVGRLFAELSIRQLTMTIVDISTTFMNSAMKNMHGSKLALHELKSLDSYIL